MEELKLIMQTLAGLGETAKEGFIWWMVISKLVPSLLWAIFGGSIVALLAYIARRAIDYWREEDERALAKEDAIKTIATIRGILGVYAFPSTKQDTNPAYYRTPEFCETVDAVRAVKGAAEQKGK